MGIFIEHVYCEFVSVRAAILRNWCAVVINTEQQPHSASCCVLSAAKVAVCEPSERETVTAKFGPAKTTDDNNGPRISVHAPRRGRLNVGIDRVTAALGAVTTR